MYRQFSAGFLTGLLLLAIVAAPRPGAARPAITRTLDIQQTDRVTSLSFLQQTDPRVTFVLETSGKPYRNLTGYTGKFYYGTSLTAAAFATITTTNVNTAAGSITFDLSASDTNTNGTFKAVLLIEDESANTFYYGTMDLSIIETTITTGADALALGNTVNWTGTTFTNTTTAGPYLAGSNITFRASGTNGQYFIDGSAGGGGSGTDTALDNRTATNNVNMGGFNISNVTNLQFAGGTGTQGTLSWNTDEDTLDLIEGNSTLQLGQEIHYHVRNNSGAEIADGSVVYATGSLGASGRLTVSKFLADGNTDVIYMLGVATEDIANDADGKVTSFGKVRGIDTSAYSAGDVLYPSATVAGGFTTNAPAAPNVASAIAFVINSHASTGTIAVRVHPEDANATPAPSWTDEGGILRATNNTVLIAGAGLAANHDQLIVSNDTADVIFRVDEDGDTSFKKWYDDSVADGRSYAQWQVYYDFRHIVDYDEYWRIEGSVIEEMTFNMTQKNLDYIFNGDTKENLLYMDADTDSVNIHTNAPVSGYGFTVATNAIFTAPDATPAVTIDDLLKITPRTAAPTNSLSAGLVFYHSTSNTLFVYDGTNWNNLATGGGGAVTADDVTVTATGFDNILSGTDTDTQTALQTIDDTAFLLGSTTAGTDGFVTKGSGYTSSSVVIAPEGEPISPTAGAAQFVAIGAGGSWTVTSTADDQFAAVGNNIDTSYRAALLGYQVDSGTASGAIGIGYDADIAGNYGVAIGYQTKTTTDGVSIGYRAESKQRPDSISIGSDSNAGDDGVIAIGAHADVRNDDSAFGADSVIVIGDTMRINDSVEYEPFMQVGANDKAWWEAGPNTPYNYLTDANYSDDRDFDTEAWTRTAYRIFNEEGDPTEPAANHSVLWVADGTGTRGDEGDLVIAVNDGTSTKWKILFDFSAEGNTW